MKKKMMNSDFFVTILFQKLPTAWVFGGRMIEACNPGSRYVARVGPTETDLWRAEG